MLRRRVVKGRCPRCFEKADLVCSKCKAVAYCCKAHQTKDWLLGHSALCGLDVPPAPAACRPCNAGGDVVVADAAWQGLVAAAAAKSKDAPAPKGLRNLGYTCYLNAVLQCVCRDPLLRAAFGQGAEDRLPAPAEGTFTVAFAGTLRELEAAAGDARVPVEPHGVIQWLAKLGELTLGAQEDVHEFVRTCVRQLQAEDVLSASARGAANPDENTSVANRAFGGWMQSQVRCPNCWHTSSSHEPFLDLSLPITDATDTLDECLEQHMAPEKLDKANRFACEGCGKKARALKQVSIDQTPQSLVLHLKRFRFGFRGKINKHTAFPMELNLNPYLSSTAQGCANYELYGVVVHIDKFNIASYGHYIAFVKGPAGQWYCADDSTITKVTEQEVAALPAYLLFYHRAAGTEGSKMVRQGSGQGLRSQGSSSAKLSELAAGASTSGAAPAQEVTAAPQMCVGGCGFFGTEIAEWYCSKCYADKYGKPAPKAEPKPEPPKPEPASAPPSTAAGAADPAPVDAGAGAAGGAKAKRPESGRPTAAPRAKQAAAAAASSAPAGKAKIGPNSPCPCGSGLKYKKCHGGK